MKSGKVAGKDYCVIDVRDDDYIGGHIKGAQNAPSNQFYVQVNDLVQKTKNIYAEARDQLEGDGEDIPHQVLVLRGGFTDFQAKYRKDPELVENWSKQVWGHPEWL
ncbi:hypothetical protein TRAPUB_14086 [Trametes pubescens]|uniref:Rhodanese domain-containing protein n=1 Tax=Trametes pubescens TaxID=154538 RepID=A0A1M2VPB7_TRAPU|nr:hypothetical protein TRAPUB_14086 [Trametes pubescens]